MSDINDNGVENDKIKEIDLLLEWEESESAEPREEGDLVDVSAEISGDGDKDNPAEGARLKEMKHTGSPIVDGEKKEDEETLSGKIEIEADETPDEFHFSEELENAIEDALRQANESPVPKVHGQLSNIRRAVVNGSIPMKHALELIEEVDCYLEKNIGKRLGLAPVDHLELEKTRSLVLDGLKAYHESSDYLREFISSKDQNDLNLSQRLSDQGTEFFLEATDVMLGMGL